MQSVAELVQEQLRRRLNPSSERLIAGQVVCRDTGDGVIEVVSSTRFVSALIDRRFGDDIRGIVRDAADGAQTSVRFVVESPSAPPAATDPSTAPDSPVHSQPVPSHHARTRPGSSSVGPGGQAKPVSGGVSVREHARRADRHPERESRAPSHRYLLEEFVVGESNRLAYTAALELAEGAGGVGISPLFIHGNCGTGKTHLLQGVASRFRERTPGSIVRVTTGEAFMNQFVGAIREGKVAAFRRKFRRVDLLCIDDVHFLASKQATQEELLHTFDEIDRGGSRVLLTCDQHPRRIRAFSPALASRFASGMVAAIESPSASLSERIVRLLASRRGLKLHESAVEAVVWHARNDGEGASVRDLEGTLTRLEAVWKLLGSGSDIDDKIGRAVVERALGPVQQSPDTLGGLPSPRRPVRIEQIILQTCRTLGVEVPDLMGKGRHKRVVLARSVVAHLSRELTTMSYPEIARAMGRPSHSTVITAHARFRAMLESGVEVVELEGRGITGETLCRSLLRRIDRESSR